jgi:hypothetical protein
MKKLLTLILVSIMSIYATGCNTVRDFIDNDPIIAKSAIQYGTLAYIEDDEDNYDKVVEYTGTLKEYLGKDKYATLDFVIAKVKSDIAESDLKPSEKLVVLNIVDAVETYAKQKLEEQDLDLSDYKATASTVIGWIEEAAELSQSGVTASQIG